MGDPERHDAIRGLTSIEQWGDWAKQERRKKRNAAKPYESEDYLMSMFG